MSTFTGGMNKRYRGKSNYWLRKELARLQRTEIGWPTGRIIMISNTLRRRGQPT